jgi:O-antigen/teichoic acid export membrane protein
MFKRISKVFIIMAFSVFFGLLKNIFLARELSKTEMGIFTLAMTIVGFIYPISLFGQQSAFVRKFSQRGLTAYNWKRTFQHILVISVLIVLVGLLIAAHIYHEELQVFVLLFLFVAIYSSVIAELLTSVARSIGEYEKSVILYRSIRFAFIFALVTIYLLDCFNLTTVLLVFAILYILHALIISIIIYSGYPVGSTSLPKSFYLEGLLFLGSDLSLLVIVSVDKFFLAKMMSLDQLAIYFSIFAITRLYDLALQATEFVLMPYSNRVAKLPLPRIMLYVLLMAAGITIFYVIFGEGLLQLLYDGKYNEGVSLIPWFCAIGIFRMFYSIPASIIGGRLQPVVLRHLLMANSGLIILNIGLVAFLISNFGLIGAVAATFAVWVFRNVGAYALLFRFRAGIF